MDAQDNVFTHTKTKQYRLYRWLCVLIVLLLCLSLSPGLCADPTDKLGDLHKYVSGNHNDLKDEYGNPLSHTQVWTESEENERLATTLADYIGANQTGINVVWTLVTGFLVMFMQTGFSLFYFGLCRAKNAIHVFLTTFMAYPLSVLGFWAVGFTLMCGNMSSLIVTQLGAIGSLSGGDFHGLIVLKWPFFFLPIQHFETGAFTLFLFQTVIMNTMVTIPIGAMAERWRFSAFISYAMFASMIIYPIFGHWVWGYGWLARMGIDWHLGHGAVDFAGSGVVHAVGGLTALAGAKVLGARHHKTFTGDGRLDPLPGHNIPMALLGTSILTFGWLGFNAGSALTAVGGGAMRLASIAANTMIASASSTVTTMLCWYFLTRSGKRFKPDPMMCAFGMLGGLVAITASCAFVNSGCAFWIGTVAGILVSITILQVEKRNIDDPVGAISVHGACGLWGVLAVGIFADGNYGQNWNGVGISLYRGHPDLGVCSLLYHSDWSQFWAQVVYALACAFWGFVPALVFFRLQDKFGWLRSHREDEIEGLDATEISTTSPTSEVALGQTIKQLRQEMQARESQINSKVEKLREELIRREVISRDTD